MGFWKKTSGAGTDQGIGATAPDRAGVVGGPQPR